MAVAEVVAVVGEGEGVKQDEKMFGVPILASGIVT